MIQQPVTLELPWPPSTNSFLRHIELPLGGGRCPECTRFLKVRVATIISADGRKYFREVDGLLVEKQLPLMAGPLAVHVVLHPPDRRRIDGDNRIKAMLDSLKRRPRDKDQQRWLFKDDDSQVVDLHYVMGPIRSCGAAVLTISPIAGAAVQQELFERDIDEMRERV